MAVQAHAAAIAPVARNATRQNHKAMVSVEPQREPRRRNCTLVITHRCNLRCRYCYETRKDARTMTPAMARTIIERELARTAASSDADEILFDFLGGEPFLEFPLMREIAEWTWSEPRAVPYLFSVTTNGTVLDATAKDWLRNNAERFKVVLSLDGVRSAQETNRPGSADLIDMEFFREVYADQPVKMTISPESVGDFAAGVCALMDSGFLVAPSFAYGAAWTDASIREYSKQLAALGRWFLDHSNIDLIPQFQKTLAVALDSGPIRRMCGTGRMMATYDVDGREYPCHLFLPWITGRTSGFGNVFENTDLCDIRCRDCSFVRLCKHCYGFNFIERGNPASRTKTTCRLLQSEVLACIWFKGTLLGEKIRQGHALTAEELAEAAAVLSLCDHPPETL